MENGASGTAAQTPPLAASAAATAMVCEDSFVEDACDSAAARDASEAETDDNGDPHACCESTSVSSVLPSDCASSPGADLDLAATPSAAFVVDDDEDSMGEPEDTPHSPIDSNGDDAASATAQSPSTNEAMDDVITAVASHHNGSNTPELVENMAKTHLGVEEEKSDAGCAVAVAAVTDDNVSDHADGTGDIGKTEAVNVVADETKSAQLALEHSPIDKDEAVADDSASSLVLPPIYRFISTAPLADPTDFAFALCVVDFDHLQGPIIQHWIDDEVLSAETGLRPALMAAKIATYSKIWPHLPFEALPDGAHLYNETFTNFTLSYNARRNHALELPYERLDTLDDPGFDADAAIARGAQIVELEDPYECVVSLFGCACIRQLDTAKLHEDLKRTTVQKSVVLLTREPLPIQLREKLGVVTLSWFDQHQFGDCEVLLALWEHVSACYNNGYTLKADRVYDEGITDTQIEAPKDASAAPRIITESDITMNLNFQEPVLRLRRNLLVIFKAMLLGGKILVFSKDLGVLSNLQYCLVGLVPTLLLALHDAAFPLLDKIGQAWTKSTGLKSSDRMSLLNFIGLPLPLFSRGSMFQPYMTLQGLDYLSNENTDSFLVGASNDILLDRKQEWFDVVVHLDQQDSGLFGSAGCKVEFLNKALREQTALTSEDKRFIDTIIGQVHNHNNTDAALHTLATVNHNPSIQNGEYAGGDDFIRSQFEDYLMGMLATVKYDQFLQRSASKDYNDPLLDIYPNEIAKFNTKFIQAFRASRVGIRWNSNTEDELFNFFEPKHPGAEVPRQNIFSTLFTKKSPSPNLETKSDKTENLDEKDPEISAPSVQPLSDQLNTLGKDVSGFFKRFSAKQDKLLDARNDDISTQSDAIDTKESSPEPQNDTESDSPVVVTPPSTADKLRGIFGW